MVKIHKYMYNNGIKKYRKELKHSCIIALPLCEMARL